jgi:hypothetical protein
MHMQDKFQNARWTIFKVGLAVLAIAVLWKLVVR